MTFDEWWQGLGDAITYVVRAPWSNVEKVCRSAWNAGGESKISRVRLIASWEPTYIEMEDLVRALDRGLPLDLEMLRTINQMRGLIISLRDELANG